MPNPETTHSPGPWYVGNLDQHGQRIVKNDHIEIATCWHHCVGSIEQEMEANARLIAAAPAMLAMLKAIADGAHMHVAAGQLIREIENGR